MASSMSHRPTDSTGMPFRIISRSLPGDEQQTRATSRSQGPPYEACRRPFPVRAGLKLFSQKRSWQAWKVPICMPLILVKYYTYLYLVHPSLSTDFCPSCACLSLCQSIRSLCLTALVSLDLFGLERCSSCSLAHIFLDPVTVCRHQKRSFASGSLQVGVVMSDDFVVQMVPIRSELVVPERQPRPALTSTSSSVQNTTGLARLIAEVAARSSVCQKTQAC